MLLNALKLLHSENLNALIISQKLPLLPTERVRLAEQGHHNGLKPCGEFDAN